MLLKIYCENIIVTFLKQDILFFIVFLFSPFSFHPYVFFFPYAISSTHVVSLSPPPSFPFSPSFKSPALLPSLVKKFSSTLSFFLQFTLSGFFFFFSSTRCPYISIPHPLFAFSPSCVALILQRSLSVSFLFLFFLFFFIFF